MRIKGFADTDEGWVHIDIVDEDYRFKTIENADDELIAKQGIVIIGRNQTEFDGLVTSLWKKYFSEMPEYIEE